MRRFVFALLAAGALASPARADMPPLTAEQRQGLDAAMRDWTLAPFGGSAIGQHYTQAPDGNHYRLDVPFRTGGAYAPVSTIVLDAKPLNGSRWALDSALFSAPAIKPGVVAPPAPRRWTEPAFRPRDFVSQSVVDPSLGLASTFDGVGSGLIGDGEIFDLYLAITTGHYNWRVHHSFRLEAYLTRTRRHEDQPEC